LAATPRPDSDAPAGAAADWLPHEPWVDQRWLPFDERALIVALGMPSEQIFDKVSASRRTLNQLAQAHGVSLGGLAARLLASRHLKSGSARRWTLLARTRRVLSQSHLAAHMLGHVFHLQSVIGDPRRTFGVSLQAFRSMYFFERRSFAEIAAAGGVSLTALRRRALAFSRVAGREGVVAGAMSARENRVLRARDAANFESWANYRVPGRAVVTHGFLCHLPSS
jgi:hypothetical protein